MKKINNNLSMMKNFLFYCICFLIVFVNSCNTNSSDNAVVNNYHMSCKFYTRVVVLPYSSGCDFISDENQISSPLKDTIINDEGLIDQINIFIKKLQHDTSQTFGSSCLNCIVSSNNSENTLCIDWNSNVLLNNIPVERNDTLVFLIKRSIGFYDYYSTNKNELKKWFSEYEIY
jgi:hypothetical protein